MSYYNLRNVLTQSPEKIKVTVLAVLGVVGAVIFNWEPDLLETVGVGIAVERLLDLFYVAPVQNADREKRFLESVQLGKTLSETNLIAEPGMFDPIPTTGAPRHMA